MCLDDFCGSINTTHGPTDKMQGLGKMSNPNVYLECIWIPIILLKIENWEHCSKIMFKYPLKYLGCV